jgi:hypothetical protein
VNETNDIPNARGRKRRAKLIQPTSRCELCGHAIYPELGWCDLCDAIFMTAPELISDVQADELARRLRSVRDDRVAKRLSDPYEARDCPSCEKFAIAAKGS